MIAHPDIQVLVIAGSDASRLEKLISYLGSMHHVHVSDVPDLPGELSGYDVIVTTETSRYLRGIRQPLNRSSMQEKDGSVWLTCQTNRYRQYSVFGLKRPARKRKFALYSRKATIPLRSGYAGCCLCRRPLSSPGTNTR